MRRTYVGIIHNERCDMKIFVLAENALAARASVLARCADGLGETYREEDLQIIAFAQAV